MVQEIDVVVAGAINTDLVATVERAPEAGETVTGRSFSVFGGGKGANQAVAARRSGAGVAMVGAVGDDAFGVDRKRELSVDGVDVSSVATIDGMTSGVALITVEQRGENRIAYVPGPTLRILGADVVAALERHRPKVYLQPNEIPPEAASDGLRAARRLGAITVLNATPDPETVLALLDNVDVLIVNEGEARTIHGGRLTLDRMAAELSSRFSLDVILTAGDAGAYGFSDGDAVHVPAPAVKVLDTTGAGDTFCGAFAASLVRGSSFAQGIRWAVQAGALAATRAGAQPSIPSRSDVDAFIAAGGW